MFDLKLAYIDPGTGSLLISALVGGILTFLFTLKGIFYKVLSTFSGKASYLDYDFTNKLVFFNEGQRYWHVFEPVLTELIKNNQTFVYLTSDKNDIGLKLDNEFTETYYCGSLNQSIILLNKLKAKMCVMTTQQLDILTLKRSKGVSHYCNLLHSPVDIHYSKIFAFDRFDSVLCSNTFQIKNLRKLENIRNGKKKELFETGCTYYDNLKKNSQIKRNGILIAPSWGEKSFIRKDGKRLIRLILNAGYKVIFRPHPQSFTADKKIIDEIINVFELEANFILDKSHDNNNALSSSEIVISSISGLVFDAIIGHKIPTIGIDINWDKRGWEAYSLSNASSTHLLLEEVGGIISDNEINNIVKILKDIKKLKIKDEIINKYIFNYKSSGNVASEQIQSLFKKL
jgi:hypothetical protein